MKPLHVCVVAFINFILANVNVLREKAVLIPHGGEVTDREYLLLGNHLYAWYTKFIKDRE